MKYAAGTILRQDSSGDAIVATNCFAYETKPVPYGGFQTTDMAGGALDINLGLVKVNGEGVVARRAKLTDPYTLTIPEMNLVLTDECRNKLSQMSNVALMDYYVVQESLVGTYQDIVCTNVDARATAPINAVVGAYASMCDNVAPGPVVVGFKLSALKNVFTAIEFTQQLDREIGVTTARGLPAFDAGKAASAMALIEQGKRVQALLESNMNTCLSSATAALTSKAQEDYAKLRPLISMATDSTSRELVTPLAEDYVSAYGQATVECTNELGLITRKVPQPEAELVQFWLNGGVAKPTFVATLPPTDNVYSSSNQTVYAHNWQSVPSKEKVSAALWFTVVLTLGLAPIAISELAYN
jgi:hypothetical protein